MYLGTAEIEREPAPNTHVAVDMAGRAVRLTVWNEGQGTGEGETCIQPGEARRLAAHLEFAATECERRYASYSAAGDPLVGVPL